MGATCRDVSQVTAIKVEAADGSCYLGRGSGVLGGSAHEAV